MKKTRLLVLSAVVAIMFPVASRADLLEYVQKPEPDFAWKLKAKQEQPTGTIYDLHLISQTWQGITWEHQLQVYQPKDVPPNKTMLLWNTGGGANAGYQLIGMEVARKVRAPVAILYHIPKQPLFDGKKEDALIAETFVRYLQTGDGSWPLLFPMAKSVIKAMDALQAFSNQEWKTPLEKFIITGGSKRGWTSWLSAATGDARIKAIAPMVIDVLNMREQMAHQVDHFGTYSEMIHDYIERKLVPPPDTPEARKLWRMVDPWAYRDALTLPKLMLLGNNDPYWTVDALNLYWADLKGEKWVTYVPNAGHNLRQQGAEGFNRALNSLAAFTRHQIVDNPMPKLEWKHDDADGKLRLTVTTSETPVAARLWVAKNPTTDFRKAAWVEQKAQLEKGVLIGEVTTPSEGFLAFYAELDYELDGIRYSLSTQLRLAGKK